MRRETTLALAAAIVAALVVYGLTSQTFKARARAQLELSAGSGDDAPLELKKPAGPGKWQPHVPRNGHTGRHRMYRHPEVCSPNLDMTRQLSWQWMYAPPSEGDI